MTLSTDAFSVSVDEGGWTLTRSIGVGQESSIALAQVGLNVVEAIGLGAGGSLGDAAEDASVDDANESVITVAGTSGKGGIYWAHDGFTAGSTFSESSSTYAVGSTGVWYFIQMTF